MVAPCKASRSRTALILLKSVLLSAQATHTLQLNTAQSATAQMPSALNLVLPLMDAATWSALPTSLNTAAVQMA